MLISRGEYFQVFVDLALLSKFSDILLYWYRKITLELIQKIVLSMHYEPKPDGLLSQDIVTVNIGSQWRTNLGGMEIM